MCRKPSVTISPSESIWPCSSALVATVVPCARPATLAGRAADLLEDGADAAHQRDAGIGRRAGDLGDGDGARGGIDRNDIGEGAAGVDADPVTRLACGLCHGSPRRPMPQKSPESLQARIRGDAAIRGPARNYGQRPAAKSKPVWRCHYRNFRWLAPSPSARRAAPPDSPPCGARAAGGGGTGSAPRYAPARSAAP